jgi:hypothetical protein
MSTRLKVLQSRRQNADVERECVCVCVRSVSHTVGAMVSERQLKCLWTRVEPPTSSPRQLFPTQILFFDYEGEDDPFAYTSGKKKWD